MKNKYELRLGYACINSHLQDEYGIFTSRSVTLQTLKNKGIGIAKEKALENLDDLVKIILWNEYHGIRFYRLTSNLFPHMENPLASDKYDMDFAIPKLKLIGKMVKKLGHRISMHPGQFVQLGTPRENVFKQSIKDLTLHAKIFKEMGLKPEDGSVLIIHGGGTFGDKKETIKRFMDNFSKMEKFVSQYIVLENDEYGYGIMDLLPVCEKLNIPFCVDFFHNSVSDDKIEITDKIMKRILKTWKVRNIRPKAHYSEQEPLKRKGSHSKTINSIPKYILDIPLKFKVNFDLMLEVKDKEKSVIKMYKKYFDKVDTEGYIKYTLKN
jgi:UV DNA damage endonuclease